MFYALCFMIIGIDASRAFEKNRTGIEEYSFQVLKNLTNELKADQVVLYVRSGDEHVYMTLPDNWKIKTIKWPFFWTQIGLSLELVINPVDVLFVPSHVVPLVHPKKTVVTIHGLEYEFLPVGYSFWERMYMRLSIKASCRWAEKIISVSENTKKDLITLYKVPANKIEVVHEGHSPQTTTHNPQLAEKDFRSYLLFIGRLEVRKNIKGIIKAFEILKEKYGVLHQLVLAGKPGYDYQNIKGQILSSKYRNEIAEIGFVSEEKKNELLHDADVFLFPSFYEGFGLPILEAQSAGVPVVTSNGSSMPEVAGKGAILVDPGSAEEIAEAVYGLISDKALRDDIIKRGRENLERFSWSECGVKIAKILTG